jgi:signal transduction histidine kinase
MAKVEAGKMEVHKAPFDLMAEVEHSLASLRPVAAKAGVTLECSGPARLMFNGDEDKIRRILLNLLANAIKFTPAGGHVSVIVNGEPERVRLAVSDDGVGIPASEHERIFEEFHQVDSGVPGRPVGTGLGLALVNRFVELHQGRVWVESEPGSGSTFFVDLPTEARPDPLV